MTVEEKAYNYASKLVKNRLTASEVAAHYGRGYIEGQADMKQQGWHPASEPPEYAEEVIILFKHGAYHNYPLIPMRFKYLGKWFMDVKWWCHLPKEG